MLHQNIRTIMRSFNELKVILKQFPDVIYNEGMVNENDAKLIYRMSHLR